MLNFTNFSKENLENLDPSKCCDILSSQTNDYSQKQLQQKSLSQIRKTGDQMVLSSAYSTASNIANNHSNTNYNYNCGGKDKNICKSLEPVLKQKQLNQSNTK
jgi:predicted transcriptional regulator